MPPSLGKAQIRRLGERLCVDQPTPEDLDRLAQLQDDYLAALEMVDVQMRDRLGLASGQLFDGVAITLSNRLKRDRRIIEKLWRGTELDRMQDIVGFRIVGNFTLSQQDDVTAVIVTAFGGTVKDRRAEPSHGYRAVHIVFNLDGFLVEVQVRTRFQDAWAQVMESYSDLWGRGIQYGEDPDPSGIDAPTLERRRSAVVALKGISDEIGNEELVLNDLRSVLRGIEEIEAQPTQDRDRGALRGLRDRELELRKLVQDRLAGVREAVDRFLALAE